MRIMPHFVWDFAGDVLNQSAAECDVQDLDSAADCHHGLSQGLRRLDEGYLGTVPFLICRPAFRRSGLSIEVRFYIFAASEKKPVHTLQNGARGRFARQRRDDQWYKACTFQCSHVRAVEPDTVRTSIR